MPSAGNITELVIYAGIAIALIVAGTLAWRLSPMGRRQRQNNLPPLDYTKPPQLTSTRANYTDPISAAAIKYWIGGFSLAIILFFVYYFATKGGFFIGN